MNLAAILNNEIRADDLLRFPIAAFHEYVRLKVMDEVFWCKFFENNDFVNGSESQQDFFSFFLIQERAISSLYGTNRGVAIQADHQFVAKCFCSFKQINMARVQNIEATVCKYDNAHVLMWFGKQASRSFSKAPGKEPNDQQAKKRGEADLDY